MGRFPARERATVIKADADDARRYWLAEGRAPGGFIRKVDFAKHGQGVDPLFKGIKIVDCDTHFTEPPDLWTANAPAGMKDKMPHVKRINGADQWFVGEKNFGSIGGNVIAKDRNKLLGRLAFQNYDQITPGSYDVGAIEGHGCDGRLGADLLPERRRHAGRIFGRPER
jgi:hypothetical protein